MAFAGVELLEVAPEPNNIFMAMRGGDRVFAMSVKTSSVYSPPTYNMPFAVLNPGTGESLLYPGPAIRQSSSSPGYEYTFCGWWEPVTERLYITAYGYDPSSWGTSVIWVDKSGDSGWDRFITSYGSKGFAINPDWVHLINISPSSFGGRVIKRSDGTSTTTALHTTSVVEADGDWWVTSGSSLYTHDPATDARTLVTSLGVAPTHRAVRDGDWFWWTTTTPATPYVGWNRTTNAVKRVALTPASGVPSLYGVQYPSILDGVIYGITSGGTKMLAVEIATGHWKHDDLVTTRTGRAGVGAGAGKIWVPSTVTPP